MPSVSDAIPPRPNWHETRIKMARALALRSLCTRDQVGAIIVDKHFKVIGEGYNGPARFTKHNDKPCTEWCSRAQYHGEGGKYTEVTMGGSPHRLRRPDYSDCPALHAEANALMASDRSLRVQGTIYVTSHPCMACAKLIANSGLTGVYVGHDGQHQYRRDEAVYSYLMNLGIRVWEFQI